MDVFGGGSFLGALLGRFQDRRRLKATAYSMGSTTTDGRPKNYFVLELEARGRATTIAEVSFLSDPKTTVTFGISADDNVFMAEQLRATPHVGFVKPRLEEEEVVRWVYALDFDEHAFPAGQMFAVRAKVRTSRGRTLVTNEQAFFVGPDAQTDEGRHRLFDLWKSDTGRHGVDA